MGDKGQFQFPWVSLVVLATFVSGTLLVPHPFDLLRPAEKDRAQTLVSVELEVEARLWEDPFAAARRYETERKQRCGKDTSRPSIDRGCIESDLAERRSPKSLLDRLNVDREGTIQDSLVLAVMVPGNAFVGAEEARRRTRFGVLAGLQAEGYLPDSVEHIGLLNVDIPPPRSEAPAELKDRMLLPYELLSLRRNRAVQYKDPAVATPGAASVAAPTVTQRYGSITLLWVDESALPSPKVDSLAFVLDAVVGRSKPRPAIALIGPSSSDRLRGALDWLDRRAKARRESSNLVLDEGLKAGFELLGSAAIFNNAATVPEENLLRSRIPEAPSIEGFLKDRLERLLDSQSPLQLRFEQTIASDEVVLEALKHEVEMRLPSGKARRVVLVTESDSIYARALGYRFNKLIKDFRAGDWVEDQIYFFRGVDGVTVREGAEPSAMPKADAAAAIEWPESRDQLDYLRRMARELKRSETLHSHSAGGNQQTRQIGAIGIFANDVHDKLLILQALHDEFPDKVFFTTDMDARYLHPRTLPFTRNLVVASSLPLQFPIGPPLDAASAPVRGQASLQKGTPPFRDVYQAATFVAARLAACRVACESIRRQASKALDSPTVYEIGRDHAVALAGYAVAPGVPEEPTGTYLVGLCTYLLLLALGLVLWPVPPSLRAAREWVSGMRVRSDDSKVLTWMSVVFSAIYSALFGFAVGSVVEAVLPGRLGVAGVLGWSGLAALAALVAYPGASLSTGDTESRGATQNRRATSAGLLLLLLVAAYWLVNDPGAPGSGEPMAWLQGISGWPSHFLNLLAVVTGLVTLDVLWSGIAAARKTDEDWLGLKDTAQTKPAGPDETSNPPWRSRLARAWHWVKDHSLAGWVRGAGDFADVWHNYLQRGAGLPRLMRVAFWYSLTVVGGIVLFAAFSDYQMPEVPVRGFEHRVLITIGYAAALLLLPLVAVAVADATMLACHLLRLMGKKRTQHSPDTIARFAATLGSAHKELWERTVQADPSMRPAVQPGESSLGEPAACAPKYSLLDDWIDIQLIARCTKAVAPLVVAPFVMLALVVVARSRLFDNWAMSWPIAAAAAFYVLWLGVLAVLLKQAAENCREGALERMNADLRWMAGSETDRKDLVEPMKRLIAAVEVERSGAFAPPFDQPFFKGLLVPLGGAGAAQLLESLLLAR